MSMSGISAIDMLQDLYIVQEFHSFIKKQYTKVLWEPYKRFESCAGLNPLL